MHNFSSVFYYWMTTKTWESRGRVSQKLNGGWRKNRAWRKKVSKKQLYPPLQKKPPQPKQTKIGFSITDYKTDTSELEDSLFLWLLFYLSPPPHNYSVLWTSLHISSSMHLPAGSWALDQDLLFPLKFERTSENVKYKQSLFIGHSRQTREYLLSFKTW